MPIKTDMAIESGLNHKLISNADHDIRQPLHAIGMFTETLERKLTKQDNLFLVSKIKQSAFELNNLLSNLLEISRIQSNNDKIDTVSFCLSDLADELASEYKPLIDSNVVNLNIALDDALVDGNQSIILRIAKLLINHSIDFAIENKVYVYTTEETEHLKLTILCTKNSRDDGSANFHPKQPIPSDCKNAKTLEGNIGVTAAQLLASQIGLSVDAYKNDTGKQFEFRLPLTLLPKKTALMSDDTAGKDKRVSVLILDDNQLILESTSAFLSQEEYDVHSAITLQEAIDIVLKHAPDIWILDNDLSEHIKVDTTLTQLSAVSGKTVPCLVITGNTEAVNNESSRFSHILEKPLNPGTLLDALKPLAASVQNANT